MVGTKAWFSYAAELPATWPPALPGILFRDENIRRRQQQPSRRPLRRQACEVDLSSTSQARWR